MTPKKWKQNQVQPFNDHFFCSAWLTATPHTTPVAARLEFLADHCLRPLYSHSLPPPTPGRCPPLSPLCPLPTLPSSPSLICPDIDGSWMLANDCLWRPFMHPLLTLPVTPHRLDLLANRSPRLWISLSVLQLAQSFNLFIYIILFLLIPMSAPNL